MNPRKKTVLETDFDLYHRGLRTKHQIFKIFKNDPEAILYLQELFNPKP